MNSTNRLLWILAVTIGGLCAACSQQSRNVADSAAQGKRSVPVSYSAKQVASGQLNSLASLPDRGDLLRYQSGIGPRSDGAYTWYPVDLSEEHALRAVISGEMRLTAPDGRIIALSYERHVEHPDGNWTWIGRGESGQDAILTFGEHAVFGSIPDGGEWPLRITMRSGRVWIVRTDGGRDARVTRPGRTDILLPPFKAPSASLAANFQQQSRALESIAPSATAVPTVDLLLGYTSGFAAEMGGPSEATTRLTYLVEVANQSLVNSQLPGRIRLIRTVQVSYPDKTNNQAALEDLTGYRDGNRISVPSTLQPLRDARESSGADLVSLVRLFRAPENDGCGVAWLLGFQQQSVDQSWSEFGYSVVSDGTDFNETVQGNFFCRDETLAHELGHNMGSAHDRETAKGDNGVLDPEDYGRYSFSFGQKTGSAEGNFFTVMAYGDSGQTAYRVFSNPRINYCGGAPCGVADVSDNARSLSMMMPVISQFRAEVKGSFADVSPGNWAYSQIERIFAVGITAGCSLSPRLFCPSKATSRDEMAVFILRAKYGSAYQPPAARGVFSDVPISHWAASWIERLRVEGISNGCQGAPLKYCPGSAVTREQMAIFLLRAKHGSTYVPPSATGVFADVPTSYWAAPWIEQLAMEGVTGGCAAQPLKFCPTSVVTRDQMAVFLVRAFGL